MFVETSRLPNFLDNWLTDGGEALSLRLRPAALYTQEDPWYSFLLEPESIPGPLCGWKDQSTGKSIDICNRTPLPRRRNINIF
jgi:hypothetical protein